MVSGPLSVDERVPFRVRFLHLVPHIDKLAAMAVLGQAHHFVHFNPDVSEYARNRYAKEAQRLYGVLDKRLGEAEFLAGEYSIADIATWPWISRYQWQNVDMNDFPNVKEWYVKIAERPAVQKGYNVPATDQQMPMP